MADNNGVITGGSSKDTTITDMVLNVAYYSTFGDGPEGQNVADDKSGLLAAVDELTSVHTLGGDKELVLLLVPEWVTEGDLGKGGSTPGIVNDVCDDSFEITISLAEVEASEPGWSLAVVGVGLEHRPCTFTLCTNYSPHGSLSPRSQTQLRRRKREALAFAEDN